MHVSEQRLTESLNVGNEAEIHFKNIIVSNGFKWKKSNTYENKNLHFDCRIKDEKGVIYKVEVKAQKKINSTDEFTSPNDIWLELTGIEGYKGWIYGEADLLSFDIANNEFILVKREDIVKFIEKKILENGYKTGKKHYEIYNWPGRKDKLVLSKLEDIKNEMIYRIVK